MVSSIEIKIDINKHLLLIPEYLLTFFGVLLGMGLLFNVYTYGIISVDDILYKFAFGILLLNAMYGSVSFLRFIMLKGLVYIVK